MGVRWTRRRGEAEAANDGEGAACHATDEVEWRTARAEDTEERTRTRGHEGQRGDAPQPERDLRLAWQRPRVSAKATVIAA